MKRLLTIACVLAGCVHTEEKYKLPEPPKGAIISNVVIRHYDTTGLYDSTGEFYFYTGEPGTFVVGVGRTDTIPQKAGQIDTAVTNFDTTAILLYNPISIYYDSIPKPKYDTIPIIYLYCDTARVVHTRDSWYIDIQSGNLIPAKDTGYSPPNKFTYWDFGYDVRERKSWVNEPGTHCVNCPLYTMEHTSYLDRHKQPIRKVIIWQTKTIEK